MNGWRYTINTKRAIRTKGLSLTWVRTDMLGMDVESAWWVFRCKKTTDLKDLVDKRVVDKKQQTGRYRCGKRTTDFSRSRCEWFLSINANKSYLHLRTVLNCRCESVLSRSHCRHTSEHCSSLRSTRSKPCLALRIARTGHDRLPGFRHIF